MGFIGQAIECASWRVFREQLNLYFERPRVRRSQLWFRGQSNASYGLTPTLDRRGIAWVSDTQRDQFNARLLSGFKEASMRLGLSADFPDEIQLELLARHHGLLSPLIDWTTSPFIAAYFALASASVPQPATVSIWVLDRSKEPEGLPVEFIDDPDLLLANRRALAQRGVFVRVASASEPLEVMLESALTKFVIRVPDRRAALSELEAMTIDAGYLMNDFSGAAEAANITVINQEDWPT